MNVRRFATFTVLVLNTLIVSSLFAQGGRGARLYDPSTEATVQGKITAVTSSTGRAGWKGIHLKVESQGQQYDVHVGPAAYIEKNGFTYAVGDEVEIVGSEVTYNGAKALIAREMTSGGKTLPLRDKQGVPLWSGGRMMNQ